ncbi:MAG: BrnA antitoxin family protein [Caulobacteraceae bacterium]
MKDLKGGDSDWERVKSLTDEQIDAAIASDPDAAPELDEEWFRNAILVQPGKIATSMRIDDDVMAWFRSGGKGWQTRMNAVLRAFAKAHGGVK